MVNGAELCGSRWCEYTWGQKSLPGGSTLEKQSQVCTTTRRWGESRERDSHVSGDDRFRILRDVALAPSRDWGKDAQSLVTAVHVGAVYTFARG